MKAKINLNIALMLLVALITGAVLGVLGAPVLSPATADKHSHLHSPRGTYRFTNPLLDCDIASEILDMKEYRPFKHKIKKMIAQKLADGEASSISFYVRNLDNGASFGSNSKALYSPASLLKVPLMMAWLKRAERDPTVLQQSFRYDGSEDLTAMQNIKPHETLRPGISYTIEDLIIRMLSYSDNNAYWLLLTKIDTQEIDAIVAELNIDLQPSQTGNEVSVRSYSRLYRILYNATFLNRKMSEKALEYLLHRNFREGIVAGVPAAVPVASKFGEKTFDDGRTVELHEFGIVYHPRGPYLLGIMTRGGDFGRQSAVLRDISRLVYAEVDALHIEER